jgi:membrane protease YdiL (CAAX protease family)
MNHRPPVMRIPPPEGRPALAVATGAVVVVALAALMPELRGIVLLSLVGAFLVGTRIPALLVPSAAVIPVAVNLAWGTWPPPTPAGLEWCADPLSPPAMWRLAEAVVVFAAVGLLAWRLRATPSELGLVRPSRRLLAISVAVAVVVAVGSLALGTAFAGPFFGAIELRLDDVRALAPALLLAVANGSMEEVAYRGAMLGWLTPSLGIRGAIVAQAIVFGAAHGGDDFVTSPLPVMLAVAIGGAIAGVIVRRTGSLTFPIAVHAAFDVPLYYVAACRMG